MSFSTVEMAFVTRVLASCLDIRSVWSLEHGSHQRLTAAQHELLAFADAPTLSQLRKSEHLHRADVEFLVVVDGDRFESAWGPCKLSGSLARWAWREVSPHEAYYDESRWGDTGAVVRVRRRAVLVWQSSAVAVN